MYSLDVYNNKQESIEANKDIDESCIIDYCKLIIQIIKSNIVDTTNVTNEMPVENENNGNSKVDKNGKANGVKSNGHGHNINKAASQNIGFFNNLINFS